MPGRTMNRSRKLLGWDSSLPFRWVCQASQSLTEAPRDDTRYGSDPEYTKGWNDGQQECYTDAMASPRNWGGKGGR